MLANVFERKGDYDAAIKEYQFVADRQPTNLVVANNLASLLFERRADENSRQRALALSLLLEGTSVPRLKDTRAWASYIQGDFRTAVKPSEEAVADSPEQPIARFHLGMAYVAVNEPIKASEQFRGRWSSAPIISRRSSKGCFTK